MTKTYALLIGVLFLLSGCGGNGQVLNLPEKDGDIHFYAFVEGVSKERETSPEYDRIQALVIEMQTNEAIDLTQVDIQVKKEDTIEKYKEIIDGFPTYVLLDHEGIVLKTSNLDDVQEYVENTRIKP
ncbi:hypothetical protein SAMN05192559_11068 [Halobacillus karajensis]|uniref:Uncharacterized protein n=1 Tax=Halobacillus karajensis TaxID=195088 RepID=A0A024P8D8_9BACI|nr:hypothetical protein [Halobacillus karajensis]CDQ21449.1 hypothetical protein BN982_03835 [Halobacillus karajensis]CDQ25384.1 hypothetical protein BN983_03715 [Halobacillus karajensis]CDQ29708.1 hypothetical protein BN981_04129 [Halobacillus karajensis]SEI07751.1 hypothetical protein SAMN05192559_11068 [Halobacillus karajensis]